MRRALAAALALATSGAWAVSPDLKVSTDDLNEAGEQFLELQANKASGWPLQAVAEYSYGITDQWQVAAMLPFAGDDRVRTLGATLELRYVPAHDRERGGYWGLDFSAGRARERVDEAFASEFELTPVFGYRTAAWHFAGNLSAGFPASGEERSANYSGAAKAAYRLDRRSEVGLEYFVDERKEYLLLAWDKVVGNELNVAIGRGLTGASERWVLKLVYSFPLLR